MSTRRLPPCWWMILNNRDSRYRWAIEIGIGQHSWRTEHVFTSEREANRAARRYLRHIALDHSTTGWSSTGMAHVETSLAPGIAWCGAATGEGPDLGGKVSSKCSRCERIIDALEEEFGESVPEGLARVDGDEA